MCVLRPSGRWLVSAANPRTREDSSAVGPGEEEAFQTVTAPTGILLKNHPSPGQTRSLFAEVLTFFLPFFQERAASGHPVGHHDDYSGHAVTRQRQNEDGEWGNRNRTGHQALSRRGNTAGTTSYFFV